MLDFKSLYPTIIRSFLDWPNGPDWRAKVRVRLWRRPSSGCFVAVNSTALSTFYQRWSKTSGQRVMSQRRTTRKLFLRRDKIIMNSFFYVLGSSWLSFFRYSIGVTITMRGYEIAKQTKNDEDKGYQEFYGDTDSTFVPFNGSFEQEQSGRDYYPLWLTSTTWWTNHLKRGSTPTDTWNLKVMRPITASFNADHSRLWDKDRRNVMQV